MILTTNTWLFLCVSGKPGPQKGQGTKSTQNPQHYGQLPTAVLFALSTKKEPADTSLLQLFLPLAIALQGVQMYKHSPLGVTPSYHFLLPAVFTPVWRLLCGSGRGLKALFDTARKLQPPTARSPLRNSRTGYGYIRCGASGCRVQRSLTPAKGN